MLRELIDADNNRAGDARRASDAERIQTRQCRWIELNFDFEAVVLEDDLTVCLAMPTSAMSWQSAERSAPMMTRVVGWPIWRPCGVTLVIDGVANATDARTSGANRTSAARRERIQEHMAKAGLEEAGFSRLRTNKIVRLHHAKA